MRKPVVTKHRLRGPSEIKERMRKAAAQGYASRFVGALQVALAGQSSELVIEVCRVLIRGLSRIVETNGDIGRAHGVLSGAATDLSPAYKPEKASRADADAHFKGAA